MQLLPTDAAAPFEQGLPAAKEGLCSGASWLCVLTARPDPCLLLNAPVDPVPTLDELDSYQLLRFCVAGQLHKAKAAMTEVCNLDIAGGLPEGVRVAGLHASCTHAA